jgi:hypothetical protein
VKKFPSLYTYLPHNDTITNIDERIEKSVHFPIGKGFKERDFVEEIYKNFPSQVENVSSINLSFLIQEAKMTQQYVVLEIFMNDEEVSGC